MSLIFLYILLTLTIIYNIYVIKLNKSIPESISQTSYILNGVNGKYYLFSVFCLITTGILLPIWLNFSNENYQFLVFLCCGGILFAGSTPFFKEDFEKPIHYVSGILAVVTYIIWCIVSKFYSYLIIEGIILLFCLQLDRKNYVYYIEIIGLLGLLILLIKNV